MSCPTVALGRSTLTALRRPPAATADAPTADAATADVASDALAAIASTYEDARAGIISGEPSPAVVPADVPAGYSPTVPLTLFAKPAPAPEPQSPGALQTVTALWSRLLRRVESGRRGRHSATESEGLPAEAFQWGPPGRVRFLSQM